MRKRILAVLLCALLFLALLPAAPAVAEVRPTFVSINDTLPPELINTIVYYGGRAYAPWYLFTNYGLGINYSFFISAETAYFHSGDRQLFFGLRDGDTFDGDDYHFSIPAIYWGGVVYAPLSLTCSFFGLHLSTVTGSDYGDIVRITTDAVLSDEELQRAATNLMRKYYLQYNAAQPTETPAPVESEPPETHEGEALRLSFVGLPAAALLDRLRSDGVRSCFFLTAEQVRSDPDRLRRMVGEGHALGVWCDGDPAETVAETAALIFAATRTPTLLLASLAELEEAAADYAAAEGLVWCTADLVLDGETPGGAWEVAAWLDATTLPSPALRLDCGAVETETLIRILAHVREQKYAVVRPRETAA